MRNALIIGGGVVAGLAVLGGLWWYLLLNGGPTDIALENPFATGGEVAVPVIEPLDEEEVVETNAALRRIGTRPVAGAAFVEDEGRVLIHYAELGTGHLYAADPETGTTTRLSGTTVPRTVSATWSPTGTEVVLVIESSAGVVLPLLATLTEGETGSSTVLATTELDRAATNMAFSENGSVLYYTLPTDGGSAGYAHDVESGRREVLFTSPIRALRVLWGPRPVAYAAPSSRADGYAFATGSRERIAGGLPGLTLSRAGETLVFSYVTEDGFVSHAGAPDGVPLAIAVFPEKCDDDPFAGNVLWCAAPVALPTGDLPDRWYQGDLVLEDQLWQLNTATGSATLVSLPTEDAGVSLDATDLSVHDSGEFILLINRRDGGLWLQDLR